MKKITVLLLLCLGFLFNSLGQGAIPSVSLNTNSAIDLRETFGSSLVYFLDPANTTTMFRENATSGLSETAVTSDTNPIGLIYDLGFHGFYSTAESDATRPTLNSDAQQYSFIDFSLASSSRLKIPNSAAYLRPFHAAGSTWCIATRLKMGSSTNGVTNYILASHTGTTANWGLTLSRDLNNKINLWIVYGSAGNQRVIFASAKTLVESDGWVNVIIYANGTSGTAIIGNTLENFTLSALGSASNATSDMFIGSATTGVANFKGGMAYLAILNRTPTTIEIAKLKAYNPPRNTNKWLVKKTRYDFNNSARGWADLGKTVPITNGVAIRAWEPEDATIFGPLSRDITTASAGVSPIWSSSLQNGKGGLTFDGVDDNMTFQTALFNEKSGSGALIVVGKNTRPELGSHFLSSGNGTPYFVVTGSTYPSGALGVGNTYFTIHVSGGATSGPTPLENLVESTNILVSKRVGSSWSSWTGLKVELTSTASGQFSPTQCGAYSISGWQLKSEVFKIEEYCGTPFNGWVYNFIDKEKIFYGM